jgi:hypothetical protein
MITVIYGSVLCDCCASGPHGYGRPPNEIADIILQQKFGGMVNPLSSTQYEFLKTNRAFRHHVETGTYAVKHTVTIDGIECEVSETAAALFQRQDLARAEKARESAPAADAAETSPAPGVPSP